LRFISDEKRVRLAIRELIVPPLHRQQSLRFLHTNLGSLYKSLVNDTSPNLKHLRRTKHTHHPVDDAKGNAEALQTMKEQMGRKIRL
jgi:hypothetical protein